jgi:hypothetical protein
MHARRGDTLEAAAAEEVMPELCRGKMTLETSTGKGPDVRVKNEGIQAMEAVLGQMKPGGPSHSADADGELLGMS